MIVMKIYVTSDLHLEMAPKTLELPDADVLVLAGDIMVLVDMIDPFTRTHADFMAFMDVVRLKNYRKVIAIAGNHEWYRGKLNDSRLKEFWESIGVTYLERDTVIVDDVRFIGTTLWTDYHNQNPLTAMSNQSDIRDFKVIKTMDEDYERLVIPDDFIKEHKKSLDYIIEKTSECWGGKTVVITHHAPSKMSVNEEYSDPKYHHMNGAYYSELTYSVPTFGDGIDLWIHGHMHQGVDYMVGNTRVYANPLGYGGTDENKTFSREAIDV